MTNDGAAKKWGKVDDKKLKELFDRGTRNRGIDSKDLSSKAIHQAIATHFPDRLYKTFAPLFGNKARLYNLDKELAGARRGKNFAMCLLLQYILCSWHSHNRDCYLSGEAKQDVSEEEEEEDEEENKAEEEGTDRFATFERAFANATAATELPEENQRVNLKPAPTAATMTVTSKPPQMPCTFNMSFFFPHILYTYVEDGLFMCTVDFLVMGQSKDLFRPKVVNDGMSLQLGTVVPAMFVNEARLQLAMFHDHSFNNDTHKATALQQVISKHVGDTDLDSEPMLGEPMMITLPFKCVDEIKEWELVAFDNSAEFSTEVGNQQYYFVLSINLVGVEKIKNVKKPAAFRILGTPPAPSRGGCSLP